MFLILIVLVALPFCFLILYVLLVWFRVFRRCLSALSKHFFMNTYIRFFLESYLALCLASFLRMKEMESDQAYERFHSYFSIVIDALLFLFPTITCIYLLCRREKLGSQKFKNRFGELTRDLRI